MVPPPASGAKSGLVYAANLTENPRSLGKFGKFPKFDVAEGTSISSNVVSADGSAVRKVFSGNPQSLFLSFIHCIDEIIVCISVS